MTLPLLAAAPSPLWYATRSAGIVSLLLLTAVLILGIATTARLGLGSRWRFVLHGLHRNLSLLAVVFLAIHVLAAVLDPYAKISWLDTVVPFLSSYRPFYLGLGVLSMELLAAVTLTALFQKQVGQRLFRLVHWAAYVSWPVAVVHSLGTGSDVRAGWFYLLAVASVGSAVAVVLAWRLLRGRPRYRRLRWGLGLGTLGGVAVLGGWTFTGPLQPGWALAAGTPPQLLHANRVASSSTTPIPKLPTGLNDRLAGGLSATAGGFTITLQDERDPNLTLAIAAAGDGTNGGTVTVASSGRRICSFDAQLVNPVRGTCGGTQLLLQVAIGRGNRAVGQLQTGGAPGASE